MCCNSGLALALRHKKEDQNRSSSYDALLVAEDRAQKAGKGLHSTKETPTLRITDGNTNFRLFACFVIVDSLLVFNVVIFFS
jgi:hypothetical protein